MNRLPFGIGDFVATFKGDFEGHPFRGNQYDGGSGGGESSSSGGTKHYEDSTTGRNQKLDDLKEGLKVSMDGQEYTIYGVKKQGGKKNRTDVNLLKKGEKPRIEVPGHGLNKGKMVEQNNLRFHTFYNDKGQYSIDKLDVLE